MRSMPALVLAVLSGLCVGAPSLASPTTGDALVGRWDRDDGLGGVKIAPCGEAPGDTLCGDVVWLKHPEGPAHVGQRLLYDLRQTADATWKGSAINPEDRGTYAGTVLLDGNHATMRGCAAFGLLCRSVALTRVGR